MGETAISVVEERRQGQGGLEPGLDLKELVLTLALVIVVAAMAVGVFALAL